MAYVTGFLPWVLYWILIGNTDFRLAVCLALAAAVILQIISWGRGQPRRSLDVGSLVIFVLLAVAAFVVDDAVLEQWLQPLSNLGLLLVALVGVLIGRPFVRDFAVSSVDAQTARSGGFRYLTTAMTWMWVATFALMTVVSSIPALTSGDASLQDESGTISVLCYWVIPYVLLGLAGTVSAVFPKWFDARSALVDQREVAETPTAPTVPTPPVDRADGELTIELSATSGHDEPFPLVVRNVPAGATVEVEVRGPDLYGLSWRAHANFTASSTGDVDVATTDPTGGDWSEADPAAPIWAMRFAAADHTPGLFVAPPDPWPVTVQIAVAGVGAVRRTVHRRAAGAGVRYEPVDVEGQPGMICWPPGPPPTGGWPAVVCFGGSEGGFASQLAHAGLLASHGFAALAASWVDEQTAAEAISSIPLERFLAPFAHLAGRVDVDADHVGAVAISRGAEGLLAAAARAEDLGCRGLVLMSPSSMSWQAIGDKGEIPDTPSWTWGGRPVPWLPLPTGPLMPQIIRNAARIKRDTAAHRPSLLRLRPAYEAGLYHRRSDHDDARIAAEHIACPLLILTGGEDALWPSQSMGDELLERRRDDAGDQHLHYPAAGHLIRLGHLPTDAQWTGGLLLGGSRTGQAEAQENGTSAVLAFLRRTAGADRSVEVAC